MKQSVIAITGGIGSGKSVVSRIFSLLGFSVYDCDSRAKLLMDESAEIKRRIAEDISRQAVVADGSIDRRALSAIVFSDSVKLAILNSIVHSAVKEDLVQWVERHAEERFVFVETAILYQSGLDKMVDCVIEVDAPLEVRVERVMKRNGMLRSEVVNRVKSQMISVDEPHSFVVHFDNSGDAPLLPQIQAFLGNYPG